MIKENYKIANIDDIPQIVELVNRSYRPISNEEQEKTWTCETALVSGKRTNATQIQQLIQQLDSIILLLEIKQKIVGCIHIQKKENDLCSIGTFAICLDYQNKKLGQNLLHYAENFAIEKFHVKKFIMTVISQRIELIDYYLRRGYSQVGNREEYPIQAHVGIPKQKLTIELLEKII